MDSVKTSKNPSSKKVERCFLCGQYFNILELRFLDSPDNRELRHQLQNVTTIQIENVTHSRWVCDLCEKLSYLCYDFRQCAVKNVSEVENCSAGHSYHFILPQLYSLIRARDVKMPIRKKEIKDKNSDNLLVANSYTIYNKGEPLEETLRCGVCQKRYKQKAALRKHYRKCCASRAKRRRSTSGQRIYYCHDCDDDSLTFTSQPELKIHRDNAHFRKYYCRFCSFECSTSFDLDSHEPNCYQIIHDPTPGMQTRSRSRLRSVSRCDTDTERSFNTRKSPGSIGRSSSVGSEFSFATTNIPDIDWDDSRAPSRCGSVFSEWESVSVCSKTTNQSNSVRTTVSTNVDNNTSHPSAKRKDKRKVREFKKNIPRKTGFSRMTQLTDTGHESAKLPVLDKKIDELDKEIDGLARSDTSSSPDVGIASTRHTAYEDCEHLSKKLKSQRPLHTYRCTQKNCKYENDNLNLVSAHEQKKHGILPWFNCTEFNCRSIFTNRSFLKFHVDEVHSTEPLVCHICHKIYPTKSTYDKHIKTHHKGVRYQCRVCKFVFKTPKAVPDHCRRMEDASHKLFLRLLESNQNMTVGKLDTTDIDDITAGNTIYNRQIGYLVPDRTKTSPVKSLTADPSSSNDSTINDGSVNQIVDSLSNNNNDDDDNELSYKFCISDVKSLPPSESGPRSEVDFAEYEHENLYYIENDDIESEHAQTVFIPYTETIFKPI